MKHNVFTYGSLMFDDIMQNLLGKPATKIPAVLQGWMRHALKDRTYPGAVPATDPNAKIDGILWLSLTDQDLAILDRFEGNEYDKLQVEVLSAAGQTYPALLYAWKDTSALLGEWDVAEFDRLHRQSFVEQHSGNGE